MIAVMSVSRQHCPMRIVFFILAGLMLASCGKTELEKAEDAYQMLGSISPEVPTSEKCAAATKAKDAALAANNKEKYEHWQMMSQNICASAALERSWGVAR